MEDKDLTRINQALKRTNHAVVVTPDFNYMAATPRNVIALLALAIGRLVERLAEKTKSDKLNILDATLKDIDGALKYTWGEEESNENELTDEKIEKFIELLKNKGDPFIFLTDSSESDHSVIKGSTFEITAMLGFALKKSIDSLCGENKELTKHELLLGITSSIIKANLKAWEEEKNNAGK